LSEVIVQLTVYDFVFLLVLAGLLGWLIAGAIGRRFGTG
jgi:hypothetical protein